MLPPASRPPPPTIMPPKADMLEDEHEESRGGRGRVSYAMDATAEDSTGESEPASFPRRLAKAMRPSGNTFDVKALRRASTALVLSGLGLRAGKSWWGLESCDLGYFARREEWWEDSNAGGRSCHSASHSKPHTWWDIPWTRVPSLRHRWGDSQYQLHAESQEVFLDLMYGAATPLRGSCCATSLP